MVHVLFYKTKKIHELILNALFRQSSLCWPGWSWTLGVKWSLDYHSKLNASYNACVKFWIHYFVTYKQRQPIKTGELFLKQVIKNGECFRTCSSWSWASTSIVGFPKYSFVSWTHDFTELIWVSTTSRSCNSCLTNFPLLFTFSCMLQKRLEGRSEFAMRRMS